jgi:hypothetical protein
MDQSTKINNIAEFFRVLNNVQVNEELLSNNIMSSVELGGPKLIKEPTEKKISNKCFICRKKLSLGVTFECGCDKDKRYCLAHRFPEEHTCTKPKEKIKLEKVVADKLQRI